VHHLGATRSSLKPDHLLQTPDTFVRTPLSGAVGVEFIVHVGPQLGARFTQMTAEFTAEGTLGPAPAQRFLYLLEGELELKAGGQTHLLVPGGFAYVPQGAASAVRAVSRSRAAVIEKPYESLHDKGQIPEIVVGNEAAIPAVPLLGDDSLRVRSLMHDGPAKVDRQPVLHAVEGMNPHLLCGFILELHSLELLLNPGHGRDDRHVEAVPIQIPFD